MLGGVVTISTLGEYSGFQSYLGLVISNTLVSNIMGQVIIPNVVRRRLRWRCTGPTTDRLVLLHI